MRRWGRSWWKWRFSFRKMHCACRKSWYGVNFHLKNHHWSIFKEEMSHMTLMVFISHLKNDLDRFSNRNEPCIAQGDHFLFGNRSLVDFQMGNEPYIAHGHRFPIRKSTKEQVSKRKWAVSRAWRWFHIHFHSSYIGKRCDRKWRFSKGETTFAEIHFFQISNSIYTKNFRAARQWGAM